MKTYRQICILFILCFTGQNLFAGESDLFGTPQNETPPSTQVVLSGSLDFRLVHTGTDTNWKYGGPGITEYGALPGTSDASTIFKLPRLDLAVDVISQAKISGHIQINYDDIPDTRDNNTNIGIVEAYGKFQSSEFLSTRVGILIPPLSMENSSRLWSTKYSLTPSAINTWVGQELRPLAAEFDFTLADSNESSFHFLAAAFSNNDPAGSILAWRGWAFGDEQHRIGSRLRFQSDIPTTLSSSQWDTPFKEIDGRLGVYEKLEWELKDKLKIEAFYYDNEGSGKNQDPLVLGNDFAWATRFTAVGVEWKYSAMFTFVTQGLYGNSRIFNSTADLTNIEYMSYYGLITCRLASRHRFTARFDQFRVNDLDSFSDNNNQSGTAELLAYIFSINDNHSLMAEFLHADTRRSGNATIVNGDASDDLYQLGYRLIF